MLLYRNLRVDELLDDALVFVASEDPNAVPSQPDRTRELSKGCRHTGRRVILTTCGILPSNSILGQKVLLV